MTAFSRSFLAGLVLFVLAAAGCNSKPSKPAPPQAGTDKPEASEPQDDPPVAFSLGDMIDPFEPPTLEQLDAQAKWIDKPVRSGLDVMRGIRAEGGEPELSAAEALKLRNDSPENNVKIRAALGRLAPTGGSGVDYDQTLVRHVAGDLKSTNYLLISSTTEFEYQGLAATGLLTFDKNFDWFGQQDTITSWQTSQDRLADKFVLRDDLFWSDGKPVTAYDYEYTYQAIMTEAVAVPAVRQGTDELAYVKAYDEHTLVFFHKESLVTNTGNMQFAPLPKHLYSQTIPEDPTLARSDAHSKLEDQPVVAGPYEVVKRTRGQEFVMRRREGYYLVDGQQVRSKPYLKEVRVKIIEDPNTALLALKSGQIEQMEIRAEEWVTKTGGDDFYDKNTKVSDTEWTEFHFVWNLESPLFEDKRVRWAMTYAVDYEELLQTICYGLYQQASGPYHSASWMYPKDPPELPTQDIDKALDLLAEAGWEDTDGDGVLDKQINGRRRPFEFTLLSSTTETSVNVATLMKESLDLVGVVCNVKPTEFTVLQEKNRNHEFEASMAGWGTSTDPSSGKNIFGTGEGRNYGSYSNPEVDKLYEQGLREFDRDKRAAIYSKIHLLMWEDQPYTWLFNRNSFYGFNKKLRGYNFSPRGPFSYSPGFDSLYVPAATP